MKPPPPLSLKFSGGTDEVTGSRHLLETPSAKVLLDCGMFQGHRREAIEKNRKFLFDPKTINSVLLSHAHIDHSGTLPLLMRNGYDGPIHCTHITGEITSVMLMDSARLQVEDAKFFNKIHRDDGESIEPLYDEDDARRAIDRLVGHEYGETFPLADGMKARFWDAGHVLGSAFVEVAADTPKGLRRVLFTGDMGRGKNILLNAPETPKAVDYLIMESTYGSRRHAPLEQAESDLAKAINGAVADKGKILIPSFALERTQEIVFLLKKLRRQGKIPDIPFYVDSPMATRITEIFNRHHDEFAEHVQDEIREHGDPFGLESIRYVASAEESKMLNDRPGPMIILSASGMCEGGRILHHLRNNIDKPNALILIVGFQAEGTLGRQLTLGTGKVKIFGLRHDVMARVQHLRSFSAHADRDDLVQFAARLSPRPRRIFLVHGDDANRSKLLELLKAQGIDRVEIPHYGDTHALE